MNTAYIALVLGAICTAFAQLCLKYGSQSDTSLLRSLFSPFVILGYGLFLLVVFLNLYGLGTAPLKTMIIIQPLTQVLVIFSALLIFGERLTASQWKAIGVIVCGMGVFYL